MALFLPPPIAPAPSKNDGGFNDPIWHRWFASVKALLDTLVNGLAAINLAAELLVHKNAANGYAGLAGLYQIQFKNQAGTFTSLLTNTNTAARTYTFPDATGTMVLQGDAVTFQALTVNTTSTLTGTITANGALNLAGVASFANKFACNGATAQAAIVLPADATDLATAITLVNALKASGIAYGFNS